MVDPSVEPVSVASGGADTPGREAELAGRVPLNVALSGTDHAWSYVFLASARSRGITGDVLHPDGGIGVKG